MLTAFTVEKTCKYVRWVCMWYVTMKNVRTCTMSLHMYVRENTMYVGYVSSISTMSLGTSGVCTFKYVEYVRECI